MKVADKRRSECRGSLLERLLACYLIDSPTYSFRAKRFTNVLSLTSESLRVVPMHCKTSAICSASGDSESQIRPTLTTKSTKNVYILYILLLILLILFNIGTVTNLLL